jgi:hypothetical protein
MLFLADIFISRVLSFLNLNIILYQSEDFNKYPINMVRFIKESAS